MGSMNTIPEHGLHIAGCFVHGLFIVLSVYHAAFSQRNPVRVPVVRYDRQKHLILSFRAGITIVMTGVHIGEFAYQLYYQFYPAAAVAPLVYAEQVLAILAWACNSAITLLLAKNGAWVYFHVIDHFLMLVAWAFVMGVQAVRFHVYVIRRSVESSSEQLTATIILALSLVYAVTLIAFHVVSVCRMSGRCLGKYSPLEGDQEDVADYVRPQEVVPDVVEHSVVVVHRPHDDGEYSGAVA
ncbi:hypothetical protein BV898_19015 [Hypsibius exemplaris]|uniref:Uncharacterized protein n=1 Tax=Hypsibius exemplaris TaxID=2072580 RepID=A0A9X6NKX3_HYPEX|nr:hypothetical protein BV898_19015 [Hypsibius exemplaris]